MRVAEAQGQVGAQARRAQATLEVFCILKEQLDVKVAAVCE